MICVVLLAAYAAGAGFLAPALLDRDWSVHAPRLAIGVWLALSASFITAAVLAAVAMAVRFPLSWHMGTAGGVARAGYLTPGAPAMAAAGLLLAAAIVLRTGGCLAGGLAQARRERREHAAFLAGAGRADPALGAVILDQDAPAAYCLPGGRHVVVVSAGVLAALDPAQLEAVLAHERAHLRGHHHAMLTWASALGRALPMVPLLARAGPRLATLAEMAADDRAARRHAPADLAAALVILARAGARAAALTAGGTAAIARIERLLAPPPRRRRPARLAAAAATLTLPALLGCLSLLAAACGTHALGGPAALAAGATRTWTVQPGGAITATAGKITLTNAAAAHPVTCVSSKATGTLRSGSGLPGADAGSLSAVRFATCAYRASTTLEIIFTVRPRSLPWHVDLSSYDAATGVVRGTLSHIALTVAIASTPPGCHAVVSGTSATAHDGRVAFRYSDSTGRLTVLTAGGNLHYYDVRSCRFFTGFSDGAPATLSATFTMSPHQDITSP